MIDTHIHIWDLDKAEYPWLKGDTTILNQTYTIDQISSQLTKAGVSAGVLVQAANNPEDTVLMLEAAAQNSWVAGVVGWLPLTDPDATEKWITQKYRSNPLFKGCRHLIHNEANARWLLQDTVIESLRFLSSQSLTYDVVGVNLTHLKVAIELATKCPALKIVLDHLNQPGIASGERFGKWGDLMKAAATYPNIYVKISGLGSTAAKGYTWETSDIKPYVLHALELFGADRCFCGGDWPVSLLTGPYEKPLLAYQEIIREAVDPKAQERIFTSNAAAFYNLTTNPS